MRPRIDYPPPRREKGRLTPPPPSVPSRPRSRGFEEGYGRTQRSQRHEFGGFERSHKRQRTRSRSPIYARGGPVYDDHRGGRGSWSLVRGMNYSPRSPIRSRGQSRDRGYSYRGSRRNSPQRGHRGGRGESPARGYQSTTRGYHSPRKAYQGAPGTDRGAYRCRSRSPHRRSPSPPFASRSHGHYDSSTSPDTPAPRTPLHHTHQSPNRPPWRDEDRNPQFRLPPRPESPTFVIDTVGDPDNLKYGSNPPSRIPFYRRVGFGRVMGIEEDLKIDRTLSTRTQIVMGDGRKREGHEARGRELAREEKEERALTWGALGLGDEFQGRKRVGWMEGSQEEGEYDELGGEGADLIRFEGEEQEQEDQMRARKKDDPPRDSDLFAFRYGP